VKKVPIVTILGHVDHGKTTILDKIRSANVQGKEVGGITQKVSVFTIDPGDKNLITFVDTPGHEAFDLMRSRGGSIADIVLLIVAANDGIKPQTEESIEIIKKGNAKPIVVINKVDLPNLDIEKIKRDLSIKGIQVEGMGGDIPVVEVSGLTGQGLDDLLEVINLVAEVEDLQKREELPKGIRSKAYILESIKEKTRGNVSTLILVQGGLKRGDWIGYKSVDGLVIEKVKGVISEDNKNIQELGEGHGGKILGLSQMVELGTEVYVLEKKDEKILEQMFIEEKEEVVEEKEIKEPVEGEEEEQDLSMFFDDLEEDGDKKTLKVIIKSSSEGSLEAIRKSLARIDEEGVTAEIVSSGIGNVTQKDVDMAEISKAIILGFEVDIEKGVDEIAKRKKILVRSYEIIYHLVDEIKDVITSMTEPEEIEEEVGEAEIKALFTLTNGTVVLGGRVTSGSIKKKTKVYVVRNDEIVVEGKLVSLKSGKNEVVEMQKGGEFGCSLDVDVSEVQVGDKLHCYKVEK
jgi:translation initiation factor IF-2